MTTEEHCCIISVYNTGKMDNKNAGKWKVKCHSMGLPYLKTIRALRCKKSQQTKMFHVKGYLMLHQLFFNSLRKKKGSMKYCSLFYVIFEELLKTLCNIYLHGQPYRVLLCNQIVLLTQVGFLSPSSHPVGCL